VSDLFRIYLLFHMYARWHGLPVWYVGSFSWQRWEDSSKKMCNLVSLVRYETGLATKLVSASSPPGAPKIFSKAPSKARSRPPSHGSPALEMGWVPKPVAKQSPGMVSTPWRWPAPFLAASSVQDWSSHESVELDDTFGGIPICYLFIREYLCNSTSKQLN